MIRALGLIASTISTVLLVAVVVVNAYILRLALNAGKLAGRHKSR